MTTHPSRVPLSLDPLITEAKWRARRRRLLVGAALAGVVALATVLSLPSGRPAPPEALHLPSGAWVPAATREIDVRANPSLRITDPTQVRRIVLWFDALQTQHDALKRNPSAGLCAGGYMTTVRFTFLSATGATLATAWSPPVGPDICSPMSYSVGARPATRLVDPRKSLIDRVQSLLGVTFRGRVFGG